MPVLRCPSTSRINSIDSDTESTLPVTRLPPDVVAAHDAAVAAGEELYLDPESELWAMTRPALLARGYCCGSGCRHCPYDNSLGGNLDA